MTTHVHNEAVSRAIQICIVFEGLWLDIQIATASPLTLITHSQLSCPIVNKKILA